MTKTNYPIYKIKESELFDRGIVRHIQTFYVLDTQENIQLIGSTIGMDFGTGQPIYIKPESMTLKKIDGKLYPVIIINSYVE